MIYNIGVVGHEARTVQAKNLTTDVDAAFLSLDDGELGCDGNHRLVWQHLAEKHTADYVVVLEDDALPVDGFREQLNQVLAITPEPIVSFYLGRLRPPQYQQVIESAVTRADRRGAHFITTPHVLHSVGLAVRADLVPDMLTTIDNDVPVGTPIDEAISAWIGRRRYRCAYTWPSLVDHADGETLIVHRDGVTRPKGRVAWRCGTRTTWENQSVELINDRPINPGLFSR